MFKVGDVVRVRKDLKGNKWYGDVMFQSHMEHLWGEKMEVKTIISGDYICYSDKFKETRCLSLEMLEEKPVPKAKEYSLIVTDKKVIILDKENKKKGISTCHEEDTFDMQVGFKLAWDRLHGIKEKKIDTSKPQLIPPEFDRCIVNDRGEYYSSWKSLVEEFGYFFAGEGNGVKENKEYKVLGSVIRDTSNEDNVKVYLIQDEECKTYVIGAKGIKPVEYKLYDCNGVELKEGDKVKCICLYDGDVFKNTIRKGVNGVLYNDGMSSAHRADKNGGMWDRTKSQYNWHIVKF